MGRRAMVWTTAGTNRVCPRCLALKGTVVGYTNESGVTLPPLHPRCRCTIEYREVEPPKVLTTPQGNGNVGGNKLANELAQAVGRDHYTALRNVAEQSSHVKARRVWDKFEDKIKVTIIPPNETTYHSGGTIRINLFDDLTGDAGALPYQTVFHESAHLIDWLNRNGYEYFSCNFKSNAFVKAIFSDFDSLFENRVTENFKIPKNPLSRAKNLLKNKEWFTLRNEGFVDQTEFFGLARMSTRAKTKKALLSKLEAMTDEEIIDTMLTRLFEASLTKFCDEMAANYSLLDRGRLSDIFCGYCTVKHGRCLNFGVGHEEDYWLKRGSHAIAAEAFAEFMDSALANQGSWQVLNKFLPTAAKVFEEMLDELLK